MLNNKLTMHIYEMSLDRWFDNAYFLFRSFFFTS